MFRIFSFVLIFGLLASNVLTLTWGAFNATLSTAVTSISGVESVMSKRTAAVKKYGNRVVKRTAKRTARSVASIPLESIPYLGVAMILAVTTLEVKDACADVTDIGELHSEMNIKDTATPEIIDKICHPEIPSIATILDKLPEESNVTEAAPDDQGSILAKISTWGKGLWSKGDEAIAQEDEKQDYLELTKQQWGNAKVWVQSKVE